MPVRPSFEAWRRAWLRNAGRVSQRTTAGSVAVALRALCGVPASDLQPLARRDASLIDSNDVDHDTSSTANASRVTGGSAAAGTDDERTRPVARRAPRPSPGSARSSTGVGDSRRSSRTAARPISVEVDVRTAHAPRYAMTHGPPVPRGSVRVRVRLPAGQDRLPFDRLTTRGLHSARLLVRSRQPVGTVRHQAAPGRTSRRRRSRSRRCRRPDARPAGGDFPDWLKSESARTRRSRLPCVASTRRSSRAASSPKPDDASTSRSPASSESARKRSGRRWPAASSAAFPLPRGPSPPSRRRGGPR